MWSKFVLALDTKQPNQMYWDVQHVTSTTTLFGVTLAYHTCQRHYK